MSIIISFKLHIRLYRDLSAEMNQNNPPRGQTILHRLTSKEKHLVIDEKLSPQETDQEQDRKSSVSQETPISLIKIGACSKLLLKCQSIRTRTRI